MARRGLSPCFWHWVILLLVLAAIVKDIFLRNYLTLGLSGNLLHKLYYAAEHGLALIEFLFLFLCANEHELGVLLSGATLHLDQGAYGLDLVQADDLVAGRDIEAFLYNICRN